MSGPSFREDRLIWNTSWERRINAVYGQKQGFEPPKPGQRIPPSFVDVPEIMYKFLASDDHMQNILSMQREICVLQRDLSKKVAQRYAEDDFEHRWKTECTSKQREKWILEGLVKTCEASPDFELWRNYAPEVTISRLNYQSGQGFLDLISKLTLQDLETVPDDFRTVPNAMFDFCNGNSKPNENERPGRRALQRTHVVERSYFLTFFVWSTLLAFFGESETYGLHKTSRKKAETESLNQLKGLAKQSGEKTILDIARATKKADDFNRANSQHNCTNCGLTASLAGVTSLMQCQRCKQMNRSVFYCSKECQVHDWKTGRPPHKTICGNKTALADAVLVPGKNKTQAADEDSDDSWGEPTEGFVRSPALLHQLSLLKENTELDYVLVAPGDLPDHGVRLQHAMGQMFFQLCMRRAVCGPAPREVYKMYQMLEPTAAEAHGIGKMALKRQFMREYGVDVDKIAVTLAEEKSGS